MMKIREELENEIAELEKKLKVVRAEIKRDKHWISIMKQKEEIRRRKKLLKEEELEKEVAATYHS